MDQFKKIPALGSVGIFICSGLRLFDDNLATIVDEESRGAGLTVEVTSVEGEPGGEFRVES